ncbi:MAG: 2-phospho-L-lactate transferase CofD family protein, partial [Terracidiphilus sp.]
CNLMTQANESLGLTASEHIQRIYEHTRAPIFDYAIVNTAPFSPQTLARYAKENASPIEADIDRIEALGVRCIAGDFASEELVVRHNANRVTAALLETGHSTHEQP